MMIIVIIKIMMIMIIIMIIIIIILYHRDVSSDGHIRISEYVGGGERSKLRGGVELPPGHYCNHYHDDDVEMLRDNQDYGDDPDPD